MSHLSWVSGLGMATLGLLILTLGSQITSLTCQRSDVTDANCHIKTRSSLGSSEQSILLEQLQGAKIQNYQNREQNSLYRVLLITSDQPIPLTPYFSSDYLNQQHIVEQLELFIEDEEAKVFRIQDYGRSWVYVLGSVALMAGVVSAVAGAERTTVTFDQNASCLKIHHQKLLANWTDEYNLQTITDVDIEQADATPGASEESTATHLSIQFESGNRLPLSLDAEEPSTQQVVHQIRDFLKLSHSSTS